MSNKEGDSQYSFPGFDGNENKQTLNLGASEDRKSTFRKIFDEAQEESKGSKKKESPDSQSPETESPKIVDDDHECPFCDTGYICQHKKINV